MLTCLACELPKPRHGTQVCVSCHVNSGYYISGLIFIRIYLCVVNPYSFLNKNSSG
jgi:hypothetical protein